MILQKYQEFTGTTAAYPTDDGITYCVLGLNGEAGEVAEKLKKLLRNGGKPADLCGDVSIAKEIGDVLWYVTRLAAELGFTLEEVMEINMVKLQDRQNRGVLKGEGDER